MKKLKEIKQLVTVALLGLFALPLAHADSFNSTNIINNAVAIVSDPTNSVGLQTGAGVSVPNNDKLGVYIKGYNATTTASTITVKLIRSDAYPAQITALRRDYESSPQITVTATTPAATGPYEYYTNLDSYNIGNAAGIGIASITNSAAGASFTNADIGVVKKIIPIRYP